jgi:basic membrane protein A and related proteins
MGFGTGANMTTWKRLPAVLAAAVFVLAVAGCGGNGETAGEAGEAEPAETASGERETALRVGLVTDIGQLTDRGFNQLAYEGLQRAERELGVETRVIESASDAEYVPNMTALAEDGFDVIIAVGYAQGEAVAQVAREFFDTAFLIIDVDQQTLQGRPPNVVGLLFREEEVGYLTGYLSALVANDEADGEAPTISSVGGMQEPPVDRFIAGYQAGAEAAVPGTRTLNAYSQDWDDLARCKEIALDQIGRGSQVVFQVAGGCGLGALDAAGERGVWGVGVDADQSFLGDHILTSAMKRVDEAVFQEIEKHADGTAQLGYNVILGLRDDGVDLGTIHTDVPQEHVEAVERVREQIVSGEITDIPFIVP